MQEVGRFQRAETVGIFTAIGTVAIVAYATFLYTSQAPAIWLVAARRITITSTFLGVCAGIVFVIGCMRNGYGSQKRSVARLVRRTAETVALAIVYAVSIGLITGAIQMFISQLLGREFNQYQLAIVMCLGAVIGYLVYVQAVLINSRTIASLLPGFVISGVTLAGMMSDDPNWWRNNFSQLGDRTTFAANVFNFTVILTGVTMMIISYFALSEITTQNRLFEQDFKREPSKNFRIRRAILAVLLITAGLMFMGIGIFRYTPHPILHNVFARGIAIPMTLLMIGMPWLVTRFSKAFYFVSDFILLIIAGSYVYWYTGQTSLTNVEALAVILFMGWFILFSRQIAALESDRFEMLASLPEHVVQEVGHARLDQEQ